MNSHAYGFDHFAHLCQPRVFDLLILAKERKLPLASEDATEDNRKIKIHRLNSIEIPEIFFIKLSRVIVKSFFLVYLSIFSDE